MLTLLLIGFALNLSTVVINFLIYYAAHTGHPRYLAYTVPFILTSSAAAAFVVVRAYNGLSQTEWTALGLSFLTLALGAPLIPLGSKTVAPVTSVLRPGEPLPRLYTMETG